MRAHLESGESIAPALKEIRKDIALNYGHTHEGHVLDRIAFAFEHAPGAFRPDALLARDIVDAEGARFIVDGGLSYDAALAFAWRFGRRAGRLYLCGSSLGIATLAHGHAVGDHDDVEPVTMTTTSRFAVALGVAGLLTACDSALATLAAIAPVKPMTFVLGPGFGVEIDGHPGHVFGRDACPDNDQTMNVLFGPSPFERSTDCVVIDPATKTTPVRILTDGHLHEEIWSVERVEQNPGKIALRRPSGSLVVPSTIR